jgi:hypothetical protein
LKRYSYVYTYIYVLLDIGLDMGWTGSVEFVGGGGGGGVPEQGLIYNVKSECNPELVDILFAYCLLGQCMQPLL